ncbi:MAG TPA: ATP-binding cassette domain-containing protein [Spirochaetia bacterium]|nr:ATP-binding cassette domain-containing protein [Spirochaetales bacterium]HRY80522.1 ATP-binding cassette domain-containing protein [Spirochaetia bacterium]
MRDATVLLGGRPVLREASFTLEEDEHVCILGPNGSGKSTIVRLISGDLFPLYREPAAVRLFGRERWDLFQIRGRLGIVSDTLQAWQAAGGESVRDTILSGFFGGVGLPMRGAPETWRERKAEEAARILGIEELLGRLVGTLSSGQMRRVLVARALVHEPKTLLLDEPYTSLDIAARHTFAERVRHLAARGHAIILVTHELSEIPPEMDRVILVKEGRILADGPKREVLVSGVISELFGIPLTVREENGRYRAVPA